MLSNHLFSNLGNKDDDEGERERRWERLVFVPCSSLQQKNSVLVLTLVGLGAKGKVRKISSDLSPLSPPFVCVCGPIDQKRREKATTGESKM